MDESFDTQASELIDSQMTEQEPPKLEFEESLIKMPKPHKAGELIELLKKLHEKLKALDQDADQSSLEVVSQELVHRQILKSSNPTIKAIGACCIADVIRLHAPASPYSKEELKIIFKFFVEQLLLLGKRTPDFQYQFYLLENIQSVKSFLLLNELPGSSDMVTPLFGEFLQIASTGKLEKNMELCMTDVLIQLIEDVGVINEDVTELLLQQFDKYEKNSKNPAYTMTLDICEGCPNTLPRKLCQYFSDTLLSVGNSNDSEEFDEVKRTHDLIQKVHAVLPDLLLNVLPILQEEMMVENLNVRQLATETMGEIFAENSSTVAEKYPNIWKVWLGRRNDKVQALRVKWLELCVPVYKNHPESAPELIECFKEKFADPDEKVRATACKILGDIELGSDSKHLDKSLLELIGSRAKDKKSSVRNEAIKTIGTIYDRCYERIRANDRAIIDKVGWIPDVILSCLYLGDLSVQASIEDAIQKYILPVQDDDEERAERLVTFVDVLLPKQRIALTAILQKQKLFNENMHTYVEMCENVLDDSNDNEHEKNKRDEFMKYLAARFVDKARTLNALRSFLSRKDTKDIKLLKTAISLNRVYKQIHVSKDKLLASLNEDQPAIVEIFQAILNRACPLVLNKSNIPHLLKMTKSSRGRRHTVSSRRSTIAQEVLKETSTIYPEMYTSNIKEIIKDIMGDNDSTADDGLEILAEISKSSPNENTFDDALIERLSAYVREGTVEQAQYAAISLAAMKNSEFAIADLASDLNSGLIMGSSNLLSKLVCLAEFALYEPELVSDSIDSIIRFVRVNLLKTKTKLSSRDGKNEEWAPYESLPELSKMKLNGVRLLVNYLIGCKERPGPEEYVIQQVFDMLWELLDVTCESAISSKANAAETSHLRLSATQAIVKITHFSKYMTQLTVPKFEKLSITLQDSCYYVRQEFAETLMRGIQTGQIHSRYYALLFLCAHEPEIALVKQVKSFIQKRLSVMEVKQGESSVLDSSLVRLIHLLAHHFDFSEAVEDLVVFGQYFKFFISCVATPDNVSFLYQIVQQIKISKDIVSEELSRNSYILSDLACLLIKTKCKEASWPLNAYGGHITLQSKLYRPLPAGAVQTETIKKSYLPKEFLEKYEEDHKHKAGDKRSRSSISAASKKVKV